MISVPMESLWTHCQDPECHQRWDVRFSTIEYLPKASDEPQRISVDVRNPVWGRLFGYHGSFDVEWRNVDCGHVPPHVRPKRQERRE